MAAETECTTNAHIFAAVFCQSNPHQSAKMRREVDLLGLSNSKASLYHANNLQKVMAVAQH